MREAEKKLIDEQRKTGTCARPDCERLRRDLARANADIGHYRQQLLIPAIPERELRTRGY